MATGFLNGQMEENMSECGKKENNMEMGYIPVQTVNNEKENGLMVKELNG